MNLPIDKDGGITIVTGFSRSGTSLMMRMLDVGGLPCVAGNKLSYEDERFAPVLPRGNELPHLGECHDKAVKILEPERFQFPPALKYNFIWMTRNYAEQAKSQIKFLQNVVGLPVSSRDWRALASRNKKDAPRAISKLQRLPTARIALIGFDLLLTAPAQVARQVEAFLQRGLNVEKMAEEVIIRSPLCYPGFLELQLSNR